MLTFSTPVLGLLVALVSIAGVNISTLLDRLIPARAVFLVGGIFRGPEEIALVVTNIGEVIGYLGQELGCVSEFGVLSFQAPTVTAVAPGTKAEASFTPNSTFYGRFLDALEQGDLQTEACSPTNSCDFSEYIGNNWQCFIAAYDRHGQIDVTMTVGELILYAEGDKLHGHFMSGNEAWLNLLAEIEKVYPRSAEDKGIQQD